MQQSLGSERSTRPEDNQHVADLAKSNRADDYDRLSQRVCEHAIVRNRPWHNRELAHGRSGNRS